MPRWTLVTRVHRWLPLVASMDDGEDAEVQGQQPSFEIEWYRFIEQAKKLSRQITPKSEPRCSYEAGAYTFHYLIEEGVCFLTFAEKAFHRRYAFTYLEEVSREFLNLHRAQVSSLERPYSCMTFERFIQKTKKVYLDTRASRNMKKVNEDLKDIQNIMLRNIDEVLNRGAKLDEMSNRAGVLSAAAGHYKSQTAHMNRMLLFKKAAPVVGCVVLVLFLVWLRRFWS